MVDGNGCRREGAALVSPSGFEVVQTTTPDQCVIGKGGIITVTVFGGDPKFTFALDGGTPSEPQEDRTFTFFNVDDGDHTVTVVDGFGDSLVDGLVGALEGENSCTRTIEADVSESSLKAVTASTPAGFASSGAQDGSVKVTVTGGKPPYIVQVGTEEQKGTPTQEIFEFPNLAADTYAVKVTDTVPCQRTGTETVSPGTLDFTIETIPQTSPAGGTIKVIVSGGTDPYTVIVGDETQDGKTGQTEFVFSGLQSDRYTVTITDTLGCTRTKEVILLSDNAIANFVLVKYC